MCCVITLIRFPAIILTACLIRIERNRCHHHAGDHQGAPMGMDGTHLLHVTHTASENSSTLDVPREKERWTIQGKVTLDVHRGSVESGQRTASQLI